MEQYRLISKAGDFSLTSPAEEPNYHAHMRFVSYVRDDAGSIIGADYLADYGHGYSFDNGWKPIHLNIGETISFQHDFTCTTDGVWEHDFIIITARLEKAE